MIPTIRVTFADGSTQDFHEEQSFQAVRYSPTKEEPNKKYPGLSEVFGLWNHPHDGLFHSFLELLANADYFLDVENRSIYYNVSSIVKIEAL